MKHLSFLIPLFLLTACGNGMALQDQQAYCLDSNNQNCGVTNAQRFDACLKRNPYPFGSYNWYAWIDRCKLLHGIEGQTFPQPYPSVR